MADLKTYSVLIAWCDGDDEQGSFGEIVHATDADDAERKARAAMRAAHIANNGTASCPNCGCTDNDGSDTCPDCGEDFEDDDDEICAEYEHRDHLTGETIFGGSVLECYEGAIWKAADLERALRGLLSQVDEMAARCGWTDRGERETAREIIAEIDAL